MRNRALFALILTGLLVASGSAARGDRRTTVRSGIAIRVPAGWHLLHGWLSDVIDPAPRLAIASFPARLSRHTCECGMPNVRDFPRAGAFLFVWEYLHYPRWALARVPRHPQRFRVRSDRRPRSVCQGPGDEVTFRDAGRVFQVEIYLGPGAAAATRAQLLATLGSLHVDPPPARA